MNSGLVDLSLFAYSPTVDHHFSNIDRTNRHDLYSSATWPTTRTTERATITTLPADKPLPKPPRRNIYELCMPSTGSKCVLKKIKRVKLDSVRGEHRRRLQSVPSAYASAPSAYINPNSISTPLPDYTIRDQSIPDSSPSNQTIQGRRHPTTPQLTLPNNTSAPTSTLPMVWLADEQMWLVADPNDPGYGYYATGPEEGIDWLPPYTENDSPASEASQSDLSPIREQFMSLMEAPRRPAHITADEPQMSPLFQEALAGVGVLSFSESSDYSIPPLAPSKKHNISRKPIEPHHPSYYGETSYTPINTSNNPWTTTTTRTSRHDNIRPITPRSESPALRAVQPQKYMTAAELARQRERSTRRKMMSSTSAAAAEAAPAYNSYSYNQGYIPYGHSSSYRPSTLSRRDSWHSECSTSATSSSLGQDLVWPVRASSARH